MKKLELDKDSKIILIVKRDNNPHIHHSDQKQMRLFLPYDFYKDNKEELESTIREFHTHSYRREKDKIIKLSNVIFYSNSNLIEETYYNIEKWIIEKFSRSTSSGLVHFFDFIHSLKDKEVDEEASFFTEENLEINGIDVPKGAKVSFEKEISYDDDIFRYTFKYINHTDKVTSHNPTIIEVVDEEGFVDGW